MSYVQDSAVCAWEVVSEAYILPRDRNPGRNPGALTESGG